MSYEPIVLQHVKLLQQLFESRFQHENVPLIKHYLHNNTVAWGRFLARDLDDNVNAGQTFTQLLNEHIETILHQFYSHVDIDRRYNQQRTKQNLKKIIQFLVNMSNSKYKQEFNTLFHDHLHCVQQMMHASQLVQTGQKQYSFFKRKCKTCLTKAQVMGEAFNRIFNQ